MTSIKDIREALHATANTLEGVPVHAIGSSLEDANPAAVLETVGLLVGQLAAMQEAYKQSYADTRTVHEHLRQVHGRLVETLDEATSDASGTLLGNAAVMSVAAGGVGEDITQLLNRAKDALGLAHIIQEMLTVTRSYHNQALTNAASLEITQILSVQDIRGFADGL